MRLAAANADSCVGFADDAWTFCQTSMCQRDDQGAGFMCAASVGQSGIAGVVTYGLIAICPYVSRAVWWLRGVGKVRQKLKFRLPEHAGPRTDTGLHLQDVLGIPHQPAPEDMAAVSQNSRKSMRRQPSRPNIFIFTSVVLPPR